MKWHWTSLHFDGQMLNATAAQFLGVLRLAYSDEAVADCVLTDQAIWRRASSNTTIARQSSSL
jgi:hypothetical protein